MIAVADTSESAQHGCARCANSEQFTHPFTMAFQPIVDLRDGSVYAYEALVRGRDGGGAASVFEHVTPDNQYHFDQQCRTTAIQLAAELGMESRLSVNFMPNAVYDPRRCMRSTLAAAKDACFPLERLIFEITEVERVRDTSHLKRIVEYYRSCGCLTAIDDFGAGHSGLGLLADFQPDIIKLDMGLVRGIDQDRPRQAIVRGFRTVCDELGVIMIAEGIETANERDALQDLGIDLMQGYLFARPATARLPAPAL